jgi:SNF2 family DNA or RNA helicase
MDARLKATHAKLRELRERTDLSLKPTPLLKQTFTDFDGEEKPLRIRYYQVQGVLHLVAMNRFLLGDDTGLGKAVMAIASLCYIWAKAPETKAIILTNKSLVQQWAGEFDKFCVPGEINVIVCTGVPAKRRKIYQEFEASTGPTVLVMGYATARRDIRQIQEWSGHILITDECSAYKNPSTQTYQVVRHLGHPERAARHWGLSATLIKNNLIEGFGIYSLLVPGLFPTSRNKFMNEYCLTRLQPIPNSRRQIPVIIGYRPDQIARFREKIDPYFLSRAKFDVAKELPVLTLREHRVGMTPEQEAKYREALSGLLEMDKTGEEKEMTKLTALTYCQEIVDHPELVDCDGDSEKMDALFTLLTEGDFADEKVIVFSRFRKMVDKLEAAAKSKKYGLSTVRVTGNEDEDERQEAMRRFQDPKDDARICWITTAAKEGVNLQAAKVLIFYDSPWSAGDFLQVVGRMVRIGSLHDRCYAVHLVARGTIDVHVMAVLRKKMKLIEQVMGRRLKGDDMDDVTVASQDSIDDLFTAMTRDARRMA